MRTERRWALRNAEGRYAHGEPWAVEWRPEREGCMAFGRAAHARYLADRVLRLSLVAILLDPPAAPATTGSMVQ